MDDNVCHERVATAINVRMVYEIIVVYPPARPGQQPSPVDWLVRSVCLVRYVEQNHQRVVQRRGVDEEKIETETHRQRATERERQEKRKREVS